ncbi:MAG: PIG-L family deacetylase [Microbacteriaceae bacterium]|nr:PIG-L family deacetylase [Microbacteriaceae bacterium]
MFVHAHPDDETITTGGTLATLIDLGSAVTVLTCTRGEKGEIVPADLQHLLADQLNGTRREPCNAQGDAVAAHREGEISAAMTALGVIDHRWLGDANARVATSAPRRYRDSGMVWGETGPEAVANLEPDALCAAAFGEIAADIATVIIATGATAVVSYDVRGGYGHPDHVLAAAAARRAAAVIGIPFWEIDQAPHEAEQGKISRGGTAATDTANDSFSVDVRPVLQRKIAALRSHRSQLTVEGWSITMSGGQVSQIGLDERFRLGNEELGNEELGNDKPRDLEVGHKQPGVDTDTDADTDTGVGTGDSTSTVTQATPPLTSWKQLTWLQRLAAGAFTVGAGVVVGAITTVAHQSDLTVATISIPLGLVVGLIVIATVLVGLRLVSTGRAVAVCAAVGILGAIAILSQESAGGSVLVPAEPLALYWVYGPIVIAFFSLAWPNLAQARRDKLKFSTSSNGTSTP